MSRQEKINLCIAATALLLSAVTFTRQVYTELRQAHLTERREGFAAYQLGTKLFEVATLRQLLRDETEMNERSRDATERQLRDANERAEGFARSLGLEIHLSALDVYSSAGQPSYFSPAFDAVKEQINAKLGSHVSAAFQLGKIFACIDHELPFERDLLLSEIDPWFADHYVNKLAPQANQLLDGFEVREHLPTRFHGSDKRERAPNTKWLRENLELCRLALEGKLLQ